MLRHMVAKGVAGEHNLVTEVNQHGLRYQLDFSAVFWNSRLDTEHARLVDTYFTSEKGNDVVIDVMAGVGPFAVPAAKRGCTVYANDLNPDSAKWLKVRCSTSVTPARQHATRTSNDDVAS
jgi:tRNA (guanine37-N1)-methyltransferase